MQSHKQTIPFVVMGGLKLLVIFLNAGILVNGYIHEHMSESELGRYFNVQHKKSVPDYEIVYLPVVLPLREAISEYGDVEGVDLNFIAFGRPISLQLKENGNLLATNFKSYLRYGKDVEMLPSPSKNCHYLHRDASSVAAINVCEPKAIHGLIFLDNATLELSPLNQRLQTILKQREPIEEFSEDKYPHIVRRAPPLHGSFHNDTQTMNSDTWKQNVANVIKRDFEYSDNEIPHVGKMEATNVDTKTLELALFLDEAAYKIFSPYMGHDHGKMQDMLLAYLNGVQALYHHPSLGRSLELVLVRLDIMKSQPPDMPHYGGERSKLLDSFCEYQDSLNPTNDADPDHWDMALYISGLDFYAYENGRKSGVTMGLATVGGVCLGQYACVIAELGTTNIFGKPYPSAGFTSVYILAHEIGHNLGMHHDSTGNYCAKEGFIMSPSRGTQGETQWSSCSAEVMSNLDWANCLTDHRKPKQELDHSRFLDSPGRTYTAKKQCEILLTDRDAVMSPSQDLSTICYSLQCKTPHRSGYYFAGPALEGTECGNGKYCHGGECINSPPKPLTVVPGGWSSWADGKCSSACIDQAKGFQKRRRTCNNPIPVNTDKGCEGSSYETALCDDKNLCSTKRKSIVQYASQKCEKFTTLLPELDPNGVGLQAPHEPARLWMGCAIFCKRKEGSYYTPRIELNDLGVSPYFPDGTWCHKEAGLNYYCIQHHCLPEDFKFTKSIFLNGIGEDMNLPQNARLNQIIPTDLKQYLSLSKDGKPLQTFLNPEFEPPTDEEWETNDYILLPENKLNEI